MFEAILSLGALTLLSIVAFFLWFCFAVSRDRDGRDEYHKWWVFWIFAFCAVCYLSSHGEGWGRFSWVSLENAIQFAKGIAIYVALGLLYSPVELYFESRRRQKELAANWESFLDGKVMDRWNELGIQTNPSGDKYITIRGMLNDLRVQHESSDFSRRLKEEIRGFCNHNMTSSPIAVKVVPNGLGVLPEINGKRLSWCVGAWAWFWPFYAFTLLIWDFLQEVIDVIAAALKNMFGGVVRHMFRDTFNV